LAATMTMAMAAGLAGCGSSGDGGITVSDPWARATASKAKNGAVYFSIESADADALVGASVDADVARRVELHESKASSSDEMATETTTPPGGADDGMADGGAGMAKMVPVDEIRLPAGEEVELEPGGFHVMLIGLASPLEEGDSFPLTLEFDDHEPMSIDVEVKRMTR
jgi:copper(I)-binding protein